MTSNQRCARFQFGAGCIISIPLLDGPDGDSLAGRIWRCSLLSACRIAGEPTLSIDSSPNNRALEKISVFRLSCRHKHVIELGCGLGLVGRAAASVVGLAAQTITFTDINDQVLMALQKNLAADPLTSEALVRHHLWGSDIRILDHLASSIQEGDEATTPEERRTRRLLEARSFAPLQHWSSAKRDERIELLQSDLQFDLILASDCLYFSDQEDGLGATLLLRMRKPGGRALIAFQQRGNNAESIVRLAKALRLGGMEVSQENGPWDHDGMKEHIVGGDDHERGQGKVYSIRQDEGAAIELLTCSWKD